MNWQKNILADVTRRKCRRPRVVAQKATAIIHTSGDGGSDWGRLPEAVRHRMGKAYSFVKGGRLSPNTLHVE